MDPNPTRNPNRAGGATSGTDEPGTARTATPPQPGMSAPDHDRGSEAKHETREQAKAMGDEVRRQADHLSRQARERGMAMLHDQKGVAADRVSAVARALHKSADDLRGDDPATADYVQKAAAGLDRFCDNLRHRDVDSLYGQARDLARRQPALVLGGTIAAGFLLSRLLKASESGAYEENWRAGDEGLVASDARMEATPGAGYATPEAGRMEAPQPPMGERREH